MNLLLILAGHFLLLSLTAIGGINATMPEMHRVLVESLHLITDEQFTQMYAISQAAPGPNLLFVVLFGWHIAGFMGAAVSLVSIIAPSGLLAILVERFGAKYREQKLLVVCRKSLAPIAVALLCSTGIILLKSMQYKSSFILSAATFFILYFFRINPIWMIILGALLGVGGII